MRDQNPTILAIGTAIPLYSLEQGAIAKRIIEGLALDDEEAWMLEKIYKNSSISRRYSVLPDILLPEKNKPSLGMSARNAIYKREAPQLAQRAAENALKKWNRPWSEITHVISVSCTGAITPGIEFYLSQALKLNPYVSRLGVNFMGCFGAFKGLSVAHKIASENPHHRVLMVCTELCTLHFRPGRDLETIVIHSLFADGSAALVLGSQPRADEQALYEILQERSYALPESQNEMTWDAGDNGFDMTLSAKVPQLIEKNISPFVASLIGSDKTAQELDWPLHPGGKAILEAVEKALKLDRSHTASAWEVLSKYGNLSSATFLYALEALLARGAAKPYSAGLGFGPGLSIEGILLRNLRIP